MRDSLIDFLDGTIPYKDLLKYLNKDIKKQIKQKYIWAKKNCDKIDNRSPTEYLQDLIASAFRRRGWIVEKINRNRRYYIG